MNNFKVILVDDNRQFREGLRFYIETILGYEIISEASNGSEFLELTNVHLADVVLIDISMPEINGIDAARAYLKRRPQKFIAITSFEEKTYLNELIEAGIKGCVFKKNIHNEIKQAIEVVIADDIYYPNDINIIR